LDERKRGRNCPMCAEGRPDEHHGNVRIFSGRVSDAYLQRREGGQRGYTIERQYKPIKMNFEMLGNSLPHLHTHLVPRYLDDGEPGHPAHMMRADIDETLVPEERFLGDVRALRALLT
jgi:HIT domain-containing protein